MRSLIGLTLAVAAAAGAADAASLNTLYQFLGPKVAQVPAGSLVMVNGRLYGTTTYGGAYGRGAIFAIDPTGKAYKLIYSFQATGDGAYPQAGLSAGGSLLYGTTETGGAENQGTVFSFDPATGKETTVFSFTAASGGQSLAPVLYASGTLYGTTSSGGASGYGTVFSLDLSTGAEATLHAFSGGADGCDISAGVVQNGSFLYGVAAGCGAHGDGTLFSISLTTGIESTLYAFNAFVSGSAPTAAPTQVGNQLCGPVSAGLGAGGGIYCYDLKSSSLSILSNFGFLEGGGNPQTALLNVNGTLYGTTPNGIVFAVDSKTGAETTVYNFTGASYGNALDGPVLLADGVLYGASAGLADTIDAPYGASLNTGYVYAIPLATNSPQILTSFSGKSPYFQANSPLIATGGGFYGTAENGGANGVGSLYRFILSAGKIKVLRSFDGISATSASDGALPLNGLLGVGDTLFGVTQSGYNAQVAGAIYSYNVTNSDFTILQGFYDQNGQYPNGPLITYKGTLYGTAKSGGMISTGFSQGLLYSLTTSGNLTALHEFTATPDGLVPTGGLAEAGGVLYGATQAGGASGNGALFAYNIAKGTEKVLHSFGGLDGASPDAGPVFLGGILYGTTQIGGGTGCGGSGCGLIYAFDPAKNLVSTLYTFSGGNDGCAPASLTVSGGVLYGNTACGAYGAGTVFSLTPSIAKITTLYAFTGGIDGSAPSGLLAHGTALLGTTSSGGAFGSGTIFQITP